MKNYRIAVEMQPTGVPKPTGFGVLSDQDVVAFLTEDQVRAALAKFDDMMATYLGKPSLSEAVERDAARYRWLRTRVANPYVAESTQWGVGHIYGDALDAKIDAALSRSEGKT
jgi:hypothetical protein